MLFSKKREPEPNKRCPLLIETVFTDRLELPAGEHETFTVGIVEIKPSQWRVYVRCDASSRSSHIDFLMATVGLTKERALVVARTMGEGFYLNNQMVREQLEENAANIPPAKDD